MLKQLDKSELSQVLNASPVGLALSDNKQNITWVNDAFQNHLGIPADEISGININDLPDVLKPLFTSSDAIHIPANSTHNAQWFMCSQQTLNGSGNTAHYITDVGPLHILMQERESLKDELHLALAQDEVTGMPNKIALFKSLEPQISRSRRYNNLLSIVIMRVNHLTQLDEKQTADLLLPISQMLNDQVRWADIVGKLDDSDFLLVLPETAADACKNLIDKLNGHIKTFTTPAGLPDGFSISISFGFSEWEKGDDLSLLMQKARKMLK
jgi:diguanylate cyclase (GGDEF)-like protein